MALSGTINGSVTQLSGTFSFYLTWSAVQNIAGNYSDVTVKTYWSTNNTYSEFDTVGARSASITINGETTSISKVFSVYWRTLGTSTYLIQTATKRVYHNSDGSKSITISARANGHAASYGPSSSVASSGDCTASGTITLNSIPRATTPTFSATTQTMGSAITITLAPASTSFKHKLRYIFGSLTNQTAGLSIGEGFSAAGNTTVTFTPPTSLANQIPNANSGNCVLYCYTYDSNGTQIGSEVTKAITLNVPSYTPTASVALTGNNLLSSTYVKGKSTVTAKITASSSYGATISSYSSVVDGSTYTGQTFTSKVLSNGSKTVKATVKDSRGKTVTVDSAAITVYDYAAPTITAFTLARQSDGTTVIATLKGTVASVNSKNAKTFQVTLNGVTQSITSTSYTLNGTTTFTNVPTDNTLVATAKITDSYTSVTKEVVLPTVEVTMDFHNSGKGIALGKVSETADLLDVNWNERVRKNLTVDGMINGVTVGKDNYMLGGSRDDITDENWIAGSPSFMGTYSQNDQWYSTISVRHRNGQDDGTNYGFQLRSILTNEDNLSWRQHIAGSWKGWKTILDSNNTKDYVVEQGTSGIWTYRKWNSGLAECWGVYTMTSAATKTWGSLYYSDTLAPRINYPFTFAARPQESAFLHGSSVAGWVYPEAGGIGLNTTTQTGQYGFVRPTTIALSEVKYEYTVVGKWK